MARRKAKTNRTAGSEEKKKENYECCGGKHNKIISIGLLLIILGFAVKIGWSISDLLLFIGAIFLVKGLLLSVFKK